MFQGSLLKILAKAINLPYKTINKVVEKYYAIFFSLIILRVLERK
jgi:hypothetical protein